MDNHKPFGGNFNDYFYIKQNNLKYITNYDNIDFPSNFKYIKSKSARNFGYNDFNYFFEIDYNKKINIFWGTLLDVELNKNIKLKNKYFNKIKLHNSKINNKYISIHFRNSDKKNNVNEFIIKIKNVFLKYHYINTLYIATDDYYFYDIVKNNFPNINIIRNTILTRKLRNLHYSPHIDKKKQMYDCFVDIYYILLSDVFIPSFNSGMSKGIIDMIEKKYSIFPDLLSNTIIEY